MNETVAYDRFGGKLVGTVAVGPTQFCSLELVEELQPRYILHRVEAKASRDVTSDVVLSFPLIGSCISSPIPTIPNFFGHPPPPPYRRVTSIAPVGAAIRLAIHPPTLLLCYICDQIRRVRIIHKTEKKPEQIASTMDLIFLSIFVLRHMAFRLAIRQKTITCNCTIKPSG